MNDPGVSSPDSVDRLFRKASQLQRQGNIKEAIAGFAELLRIYPEHMRALNRLGNCLLSAGKVRESRLLFERAASLYPDSAVSRFNFGRALDMLEETARAREELVCAVKLKPDLAMAWLHLGALLEREGQNERALACYQSAFDLSPKLEKMPGMQGIPPELAGMIQNALRALRQKYVALHKAEIARFVERAGEEKLKRVQACVDIQHGLSGAAPEHPLQKPESIYFPQLSPQAWFEREQFAWIAEFESHWQSIRKEFLSLGQAEEQFTPYVGDGPGVPAAMQNLAGSHDWDAFHLFIGGEVQTGNAASCPATTELLSQLPLARLAGVAPEAFFSILRPGAHILPHHGISNAKVAVHLPLLVPEQCAIRVGEEWRNWREGQCLIFDDSFEHEAYNRGTEVRVVLIFEVWHPDVTTTEAQVLTALSGCIDAWAADAKSNLTERL